MSADTVPVVPFGQLVDAVATRLGWDPARLQSNQANALTVYLNAAMETVWNFYNWPEAMVSKLLTVTDNYIPWQASPITTRIATDEVSTNGTFEDDLSGWTNSGSLWEWRAGVAAFACTTADVVAGEAGLYQTITGLTIGETYRLTLDITLPTDPPGSVRVLVEQGAAVLHLSDALTESTLYQVDLVATATSAQLFLQLFPVTGGTFTGQAAQCTLHATALLRTAPRPPLDMVQGVFAEDPLTTDTPTFYGYRFGPGCLHLRGSARGAAEAWVLYRPLCPVYTSSLYSEGTVYQSGGINELAYDTASGHVFRALSVDPFNSIPLTDSNYWEKLGVPARWKETLIRLALADALEEQDQFAKSTRVRGQAMDWLENAALTHYRQSGQGKNYRTPTAA